MNALSNVIMGRRDKPGDDVVFRFGKLGKTEN
jgi:hypothetical protein